MQQLSATPRPPVGGLAGSYLRYGHMGKGQPVETRAIVEGSGSIHRDAIVAELTKAASAPATVGNAGNAGNLTGYVVANDFLAALRPFDVLERLVYARRVAERTRILIYGSGAIAYELAEGAPIPVSLASLSSTVIRNRKFVGMIVLSAELARLAVPGSEAAFAEDLAAAVGMARDASFMTSIVAGATLTMASSGTGLAAIDSDLRALFAMLVGAKSNLVRAAILMGVTTFNFLVTLRASSDSLAFPSLGLPEPALLGRPVLVTASTSADIVVIDQAGLLVTPPELVLDVTTEATLQLDGVPDGPTLAGSVITSLWQENLSASRAQLWSNWYARPGSVAVLTGVGF